MIKTYGCDALHTKDKGVLGQVARVGERVLLPQLAKEGLQVAHAPEVEDVLGTVMLAFTRVRELLQTQWRPGARMWYAL